MVVSHTCEDTHAVDQSAVAELKKEGSAPTDKRLEQWLVSGTQEEKDKAAALLYAKREEYVSA